MAYVLVNKEPLAQWQAQTDQFVRDNGNPICVNEYSPGPVDGIRNLFAPPNATNSDPRPVFFAINMITNSPSHRYREVILAEFSNGGGSFDFVPTINNLFRPRIDNVQAAPPRLTNVLRTNTTFQFTFPGQRGRTNRVECTTNFTDWTVVTNSFGTNLPITFRDTNALVNPRRFYRVRRL